MMRTGHSSVGGVRSYKRVCGRMLKATSTVLNNRNEIEPAPKKQQLDPDDESSTKIQQLNSELVKKKNCSGKENGMINSIYFGSASGFTVNFNFGCE